MEVLRIALLLLHVIECTWKIESRCNMVRTVLSDLRYLRGPSLSLDCECDICLVPSKFTPTAMRTSMPIALSIMASYHHDARRRSTLASLRTKRKTANLLDDAANIVTVVRDLVSLAPAVTAVDWRRDYGLFRLSAQMERLQNGRRVMINEVLRGSFLFLTPRTRTEGVYRCVCVQCTFMILSKFQTLKVIQAITGSSQC
jgi:hypothetical protein